ncbi:MAG: phage holin, partial [Clostridiales bacterium]|nr:phage holin [Clostridiales bacterium]
MKITAGTIARTVILVFALINQVLTAMGRSIIKVSDDDINTLISTGFTVVSAI